MCVCVCVAACACVSTGKPHSSFLTEEKRTFCGAVNWTSWLLRTAGALDKQGVGGSKVTQAVILLIGISDGVRFLFLNTNANIGCGTMFVSASVGLRALFAQVFVGVRCFRSMKSDRRPV